MLGVSLNSVNSSLIATALIPIAHDLRVTAASTTVLVAGLYVVSAIAQPVLGRLADEVGARGVFLSGVALVALAGLVGMVAQSLDVLLISRVLLGVGTSACYPAAMVLVRERAGSVIPGRLLGALSISGQVSAAIGLPLGGLLVSAFGWRSTFAINIPLAVVTLVLAVGGLPPVARPTGRPSLWALAVRLDMCGALLFCATITGWFDVLRRVGSAFSPAVVLATGACTVAFAAWEYVASKPIIDVRSLSKNRPLLNTYARSAVSFFVIYGFMYGITQWLEVGRGLSSSQAALVLVPMSITSALVSIPGARTTRLRTLLVLSSCVFLGALVTLLFTSRHTPIAVVLVTVVGFGAAVGLSVLANQAALYLQASSSEIGTAAGLLRCSNYVGAVVSSAAITVSFARYGTSDAGLHGLGTMLAVAAVLMLVATLLDRSIVRNKL